MQNKWQILLNTTSTLKSVAIRLPCMEQGNDSGDMNTGHSNIRHFEFWFLNGSVLKGQSVVFDRSGFQMVVNHRHLKRHPDNQMSAFQTLPVTGN